MNNTIVQELGERVSEYTPDFLELKHQPLHPVFVYGTLKAGHRLHHCLENTKFLGEGQTVTQTYKMEDTYGGFPIIRSATNGGAIHGEVYLVDPLTLLRLDQVESNGVMYDRVKRHVWLWDQPYETSGGMTCYPSLQCFVYMANNDYWKGLDTKASPFFYDKKGRQVYEFRKD